MKKKKQNTTNIKKILAESSPASPASKRICQTNLHYPFHGTEQKTPPDMQKTFFPLFSSRNVSTAQSSHANVLNGIGKSRRARGLHQAALQSFEDALKLAPEKWMYRIDCAEMFLKLGNPAKCLKIINIPKEALALPVQYVAEVAQLRGMAEQALQSSNERRAWPRSTVFSKSKSLAEASSSGVCEQLWNLKTFTLKN